jgi:hypothetical protein
VELAMLAPLLAILFFGMVQLVVLFQSSLVTQYGAFVAARSFQVYGRRTLDTISYPNVRDQPYTNSSQTIAEAAAEKVIFESLLWEHHRIEVAGGEEENSLRRFYKDGNDTSLNNVSGDPSQGAVRVNFLENYNTENEYGVEVTYCAPIRFPGTAIAFKASQKQQPCKNSRGENYSGIPLVKKASFGIEPEVVP